MAPTDVRRFASPAAFERFLQKQHATLPAQWVAIAKKNATTHRLTHAEALDIALCFGWIDGFVGKLDDTHYALRFTPRKARSNWSAVNLKRFAELQAAGRVQPPGLAAYENRDRRVSEEKVAELGPAYARHFRTRKAAWTFFSAQPPGYRRQASWYVMSAKTEPTRQRRLERLIEASAASQRLAAIAGTATRSNELESPK
jgi:uncharacterized protein YdeI (YjbR/CyaY-like superfamily)